MTNEQGPLRRALIVSMLGRLAHDVTMRVIYPYVPEVAAGLKITEAQLGTLMSLRYGVSLGGPLFGAWADRVGHRRAMTIALLLVAVGTGLIGLSAGLIGPGLGFVVSGIGSAMYVPALIAYMSDRTPYQRRGRVLGTIELSWAISGMIGVPLMGALLASHGWRAPFIGLAAAVLICSGLTLLLKETPHALAKGSSGQFAPGFKAIVRNRSALAFVAAWFLIFFAFENVQISYGSWLETQYGLSTTARGSISTLFGVFELMASGGSSLLLDRIGKKRGVVGGLIVATLGYAILFTLGSTALPWALAAICIAFLGFEFSVVSGISVMSEQVPSARGTMLALAVSMGAVGRMVADPVGSALTAGGAFTTVALISLIAGALNASLFALGVKERPMTKP
ncbi:MAG: MFS transporter [Thermoflexales bacterium]|nr:MFS transporter [Thermoflexales bacterium]